MTLINKKNLSLISSLILALFPISFISGNFLINLNLFLLTLTGLIFAIQDKYKLKTDFLKWALGLFTILVIFSSFYNEISFVKSLLYIRFYLFFIFLCILIESNLINFRYFFISTVFCISLISFDIIFQSIFGFNILGYKNALNSSLFDKELISGGYVQKFSIPAIFALGYLLKDNKKYNKFFLIPAIIILGTSIVLSGNRVPALSFFLGIILFLSISTNHKKDILIGASIFIFIFSVLFKYNKTTNERYLNFYGNSSAIIKYFKFETKNTIESEISKKEKKKNPIDFALNYRGTGHLILYKTSLDVWGKKPIIGSGIKSFYKECINLEIEKGLEIDCNSHPHNVYLEILVSLGLVGLFLMIIVLYYIFHIYCTKCFYKFKKFDDAKKNVFFFSLLTLLVELFPIKSTGSIFSTLNATFIFLMIALMLGTSKILKKTFKL